MCRLILARVLVGWCAENVALETHAEGVIAPALVRFPRHMELLGCAYTAALVPSPALSALLTRICSDVTLGSCREGGLRLAGEDPLALDVLCRNMVGYSGLALMPMKRCYSEM